MSWSDFPGAQPGTRGYAFPAHSRPLRTRRRWVKMSIPLLDCRRGLEARREGTAQVVQKSGGRDLKPQGCHCGRLHSEALRCSAHSLASLTPHRTSLALGWTGGGPWPSALASGGSVLAVSPARHRLLCLTPQASPILQAHLRAQQAEPGERAGPGARGPSNWTGEAASRGWGSWSGRAGSSESYAPGRKWPQRPPSPGAIPTQDVTACRERRGPGHAERHTQGSGHQRPSETDVKPENSLLQRYKSVTAEMYSNKLGGGHGDRRRRARAPQQGPPHRTSQ